MKQSIVICNSSYYPNIIGGAEISTQILAESLIQKYNVYVITMGPHSRKKKVIRETINNVTVLRLPYNNIYWPFENKEKSSIKKVIWHTINLFNFLQYFEIIKLLKEINPVIVHTQNLSGISFAIWKAASKKGISIVHTTRDYSLFKPIDNNFYNFIIGKMARKYSRYVSAVIGISHFVLNKHLNKKLFSVSEKFIISNVVTGNKKPPEKNNTRKPLKIGFFGQVSSIKGVKELINAVLSIPENIVSTLYVCGDGPLKEELERKNKDSRIVFMGKVSKEKVIEKMEEVDLTFVPSNWGEPFGRVLIESFQAGTPVFATPDGGIPEIIFKPDIFLLGDGNTKSISNAIEKYYFLSEQEKAKYQHEVYEYSKKFSVENSLKKHYEVYDSLS